MKTINKLLAAVTAFALAISGPVSAATTLKFAHVYETSHALHEAALRAAEMFEKATNGKYTIEVFPASSLGKEVDINEGLGLGTVDIIYTGAGFAGSIYGPISISDFPFTLRNLKHWDAYRKSSLFQELAEGYTDVSGNEILAVSYYGSRHVTSNKPILKPSDMEGLKIRVPNAPAYVLFPAAVGANPTPMAFSEVYLALQQGVVDAQENPLTTILAKKFYEVQTNINLTGHITNSIFTVVSGITLSKLSASEKAALIEALEVTADYVTDEIVTAENELADWFRGEGVTVNVVDRAPFIKAVAPALTAGDLPFSADVYERLQAIPDAN